MMEVIYKEAVYQESLEIEFTSQGIPFVPQAELGLTYKDRGLKQKYFADLICMDKIIVEVKAIYSGLPWCRTQSGMLEPAKDVLGCHTPKRLAQGIIEPRPRPRLGSTETLLDLREHLLDRGVVRAVRRQR